jgi:hypothetical protein
MTLAIPLIIAVGMGLLHWTQRRGSPPEFLRPFMIAGAVVLGLFIILQLFTNTFGTDRNGFRMLVLLPVNRADVLLAKNLALLLPAALVAAVLMAVALCFWPLPLIDLIACVPQFLAAFLLSCIFGNYLSTRAPYRVAQGSLKPTKTTFQIWCVLFLTMLIYPLGMLPVLLPQAAALLLSFLFPVDRSLLNLGLSSMLAVFAGTVYWLILIPSGEYLRSREIKILEALVVEVE